MYGRTRDSDEPRNADTSKNPAGSARSSSRDFAARRLSRKVELDVRSPCSTPSGLEPIARADQRSTLPGMHDQPPTLDPRDKPTPEALAKLALELLREQAKADPQLAAKMRARGLKTS
jgi:hypothetical protein